MISQEEALKALRSFIETGLIVEIVAEVKSGKEATVFCCRSDHTDLPPLIAAKVYRPSERRSFRRTDLYLAGRVERAQNTRIHRALKAGSGFGRMVESLLWVHHEWELLTRLYAAGIPTPRPVACADQAILMSYAGDASGPAPMLLNAELTSDEVEAVTDEAIWMIESMLHEHCVHGDLSPYNLLWWEGHAVLIDVPQAVDPRLNASAEGLLHRDVSNICKWAARSGIVRDAQQIAGDLWMRFKVGEIG